MRLDRLQACIAAAVTHGALAPDPAAGDRGAVVLVHDLDHLDRTLAELRAAFPPSTLHAIAVKANPVGAILDRVAAAGMGLECASGVELEMALRRLPADRVVFDSPCKTVDELRRALGAGARINADSLQELDRIAALGPAGATDSVIGLRINPGVGAGRIAGTSTAVRGSKFGVDLSENRNAIITRFVDHPWLRGLHVHVGSQGCDLELLAAGAAAAVDLADEVIAAGGRVDALDIGGGLSASYGDRDDDGPSFRSLVAVLRETVPRLFSGPWQVVTEYGRRVHAAAGVVLSRVEATKRSGGRRIAVIHAGADLFVRPAYRPAQWRHRITVHHPDGRIKEGARMPWDVVGPLCFSGDRLAKGRQLPPIEPGDVIAVHDAGAYTLAMFSRYNSRRAPAVLGVAGPSDRPLATRILKAEESTAGVMAFWGA